MPHHFCRLKYRCRSISTIRMEHLNCISSSGELLQLALKIVVVCERAVTIKKRVHVQNVQLSNDAAQLLYLHVKTCRKCLIQKENWVHSMLLVTETCSPDVGHSLLPYRQELGELRLQMMQMWSGLSPLLLLQLRSCAPT